MIRSAYFRGARRLDARDRRLAPANSRMRIRIAQSIGRHDSMHLPSPPDLRARPADGGLGLNIWPVPRIGLARTGGLNFLSARQKCFSCAGSLPGTSSPRPETCDRRESRTASSCGSGLSAWRAALRPARGARSSALANPDSEVSVLRGQSSCASDEGALLCECDDAKRR